MSYKLVFLCDYEGCPNGVEVGFERSTERFDSAVDAVRGHGWIVKFRERYNPEELVCYCPECRKKVRATPGDAL